MATIRTTQLVKSLEQEEQKVKDKFSRADVYLTQDKDIPTNNNLNEKDKKEELAREGISLPRIEAEIVEKIRGKITRAGFYPTKSELFRAGIIYLSKLPENEITTFVQSLPKLKAGRKKSI